MLASKIFQSSVLMAFLLAFPTPVFAQWEGYEGQLEKVEKTFGDPPGLTRLDPISRVWADRERKRLVVDGYIALRSGQLEMLACPVGTKEHESVVAVFSRALVVHAGLLAIGAKTGTPVKWEPEYTPPTGSEIRVIALWRDEAGNKKQIDAREWVREIGTPDKTLETNFVFAGSSFWNDEDTGRNHYQAESGDLICVSNFSTATLDIPMRSSQANSGLLFLAFTERIPEQKTPVRLVLQLVEPNKTADVRSRIVSSPIAEGANPAAVVTSRTDADVVHTSRSEAIHPELEKLLDLPK